MKMSERAQLDEVQQRLVARFAELPAARISAAFDQAHARFADSVIRDFIPLLVERRAAEELSRTAVPARELAHSL